MSTIRRYTQSGGYLDEFFKDGDIGSNETRHYDHNDNLIYLDNGTINMKYYYDKNNNEVLRISSKNFVELNIYDIDTSEHLVVLNSDGLIKADITFTKEKFNKAYTQLKESNFSLVSELEKKYFKF